VLPNGSVAFAREAAGVDLSIGRGRGLAMTSTWRSSSNVGGGPYPGQQVLDVQTKLITHAIRIAAFNTATALARAIRVHTGCARANHEAHTLVRQALTGSGDIDPGDGVLTVRLDPLPTGRATAAITELCEYLTATQTRYPGTDLVLRYEVNTRPDHTGNMTPCQESWGSVENLNVSRFQGFRSLWRQIRATEANEIPSSLANSRADQCVTPRPPGGAASVATTTSRSSIADGRPERDKSPRPAMPASEYRVRQRITVGRETPTIAAIAVFDTPWAASNTIRARWAKPAGAVQDWTKELSLSSSPVRSNIGAAIDIPHCPKTAP